MKKLIAILLVLTMMFALVACGGEEEPKNETPKTEAPADGGDVAVAGDTYNAGNFSALIPDGWMELPVTDMWSEDNAIDPDHLQIIKDGTSEFDTLTKAYVDITLYGPETDMMTPSSEWYEEATELEGFTAGGMTWNGFSAVSGGNPMTVVYTGDAGGNQYQVTLWSNGDNTISVTDADVLAILASLTPAA